MSTAGAQVLRLRKIVRALGDDRQRAALRRGVAPAVEHTEVLASIRPGAIFDVGANSGQFSLEARRVHPGIPIHAFEPGRAAAARFRSIFAGDAATTLHTCALGAVAGSASLTITHDDDSSSLLAPTSRQVASFPGARPTGREQVEVRRLDDVLATLPVAPDPLLKIDVQGAELDVLEGAGDRLAEFPWVYLEVSFAELYEGQPLAGEVIAFMNERGYRLTDLRDPRRDRRDGTLLLADVLFSRI